MTRSVLAFVAVLGLLATHPAAQAQGRTFHTRLSVVPIDLTMAKTIAGSGTVTGTLRGRTLAIEGTFDGLRSPATIARVHRGPNRGLRGPVIGELTATSGTSGRVSGSIELTAAQVEDLDKGRLYVQLHSEGAPDGNLWGGCSRSERLQGSDGRVEPGQ
ncbi:MAG: CHRD domain-containing protein [Vicinamibacterales bacterium]